MCQAQLDGALLQRPVAPTATNSRNFELLQQTQKDRLLFESAASPAAVPTELAPPRPAEYSGGETFKLVQRLFLADGAMAPRAVMFCAVEQRSEDSWICARVAELLASHAQASSVCAIDANLATPSLHAYFDVENRKGLIGAILETGPVRDFTRSLGRGCLRLMSTGSITTHLAALVDGVILVVEPSFTPQQAAREAKDNIEAAGIERSGLREV